MKGRKVINIVIVIIMAFAVILVAPVGIFRQEQVSHNGGEAAARTTDLVEGVSLVQEFIPAYDYIRSISVDIDRKDGSVSEGVLNFFLRDSDGKVICRREYSLEIVSDSVFFTIPVKRGVRAGDIYTWEIYMSDLDEVAPCIYCTTAGSITPPENGRMIIAGEESESAAIVMYTYGARQGKIAVLTYIAFIVWAGVSLIGILKAREKHER